MGLLGHVGIHESGIHRDANTSCAPINTSNSPLMGMTTSTSSTAPADPVPPHLSCPNFNRTCKSHIGLVDYLRIHRTETGEPVPGAPTYTRCTRRPAALCRPPVLIADQINALRSTVLLVVGTTPGTDSGIRLKESTKEHTSAAATGVLTRGRTVNARTDHKLNLSLVMTASTPAGILYASASLRSRIPNSVPHSDSHSLMHQTNA
ncbi:unnamed protein product [Schistocephalus solidus]|uniref:Uncharacterized protein n=1 Tax=Schistocephalus solidus TaxID=70667 RepID=A0A183TKX9_SCHSO|nr:unnamed protein product [Schistocephalus solidus]